MKCIIDDITKAWNELDPELIIKHLSPDFRYDSQWMFDYMSYDDYVEYLRPKFETIKASNSLIKAETVEDDICGGWMTKIVQSNDQHEHVCYYRIKNEDGKIIKGDLCEF